MEDDQFKLAVALLLLVATLALTVYAFVSRADETADGCPAHMQIRLDKLNRPFCAVVPKETN